MISTVDVGRAERVSSACPGSVSPWLVSVGRNGEAWNVVVVWVRVRVSLGSAGGKLTTMTVVRVMGLRGFKLKYDISLSKDYGKRGGRKSWLTMTLVSVRM
jgi:hypothetical protein